MVERVVNLYRCFIGSGIEGKDKGFSMVVKILYCTGSDKIPILSGLGKVKSVCTVTQTAINTPSR